MCTSDSVLQEALDNAFDDGFDWAIALLKTHLHRAGVLDDDENLVNYVKMPGVVMQFFAEWPVTDDEQS